MSDAPAEISEGRRVSMVWAVPVLALVIGVSLVVYTFASQGPEITLHFADAEGIEAGVAVDVFGVIAAIECFD